MKTTIFCSSFTAMTASIADAMILFSRSLLSFSSFSTCFRPVICQQASALWCKLFEWAERNSTALELGQRCYLMKRRHSDLPGRFNWREHRFLSVTQVFWLSQVPADDPKVPDSFC